MISDVHIRGLRRIPNVTIVGIADLDLRRAREKAAAYAVPDVFASVAEMVRAVAPDVVHVLTPPFAHADAVVAAVEGGAHVYVEKPMAASIADCDRMIAAAQRAGRELCVGHCSVFDPLMQQATERIDSGALGDVIHASAVYCFDTRRIPGYRNKAWYRDLPGGFVEDLASHPASLLLRVLGTPHDIRALRDPRASRADQGIATLLTADRGTGTLLVSLDARPEEVSIEIRGTRGTIGVNFSTMVMTLHRDHKLPKQVAHGVRNLSLAAQVASQTVTSAVQVLRGRRDTTKGIHSLIAAFYQALGENRPAPVNGQAGRGVVALLRDLWPEPEVASVRPRRWVLHAPGAASHTAPSAESLPVAPPMRALVTGASGFIGTHLVRTLAARGVPVRALVRTEARGRHLLGPNVEVVVGDFADAEVIDGLTSGVDVVFHLASVMTGPRDDFERIDLEGTRRLIEDAKATGVRRVVFTSTMGAYALGDLCDGAVVTEDMIDVPERVGHYSRAKLLIEQMLMDAHRAGDFEAVIARPGLVFGPGTTPYLTHLPHLGTLRGDRYIAFGDGGVPLQLTYVENTVDALWLCATVPAAAGQTFTIIDDDVPTQREFVAQLSELTGRPLRVAAVPRSAAYVLGLGVESVARMTRRKPPTTRRLLLGKTTKLRFDTSRAKQILGWQPAVPWKIGLRRAVEWSRAVAAGDGNGSGAPSAG